MEQRVLSVEGLRIGIPLDEGLLTPVRGVDFAISPGETLGLVGESGCGKSLTVKAILGINEKKCRTQGAILYTDAQGNIRDLAQLNPRKKEIRSIRGRSISMIFQEPMSAFSPLFTVGHQLAESLRLHKKITKAEAAKQVIDTMRKVGVADPEKRFHQYPHEFSGGMLQRALITMALLCSPSVLVADEPTTALDVTIQAQILELLKKLQKDYAMAILYITHDLGTVAQMCDRVAVMYLGRIVETGSVQEIFAHPVHPYTRGLMGSVHKIGAHADRLYSIEGSVPLAMNLPDRCGFYDRCTCRVEGVCTGREPSLTPVGEGHSVACYRPWDPALPQPGEEGAQ